MSIDTLLDLRTLDFCEDRTNYSVRDSAGRKPNAISSASTTSLMGRIESLRESYQWVFCAATLANDSGGIGTTRNADATVNQPFAGDCPPSRLACQWSRC